MFESRDNRVAYEIAREIVREQNKNKEGFDTHFEVSDTAALGIIAAGGAAILGIVKPALYVTAVSVLGASLFPIGATITTIGVIGISTQIIKDKKRSR